MEGLGILIVMIIFLWSITKTITNASEKITNQLQKQNGLLEDIKERMDKNNL
ncbi:hypothetical protein [Alkalihalobacillus sp. CinArs1]|uniref:hypothetical protein n=1 Tax=Alkalihalobacillus sp. CinArs1 TaxID=2995314 RepID=UPI0022DE57C1|nr:hypothetical protein [Alkalihalobacillus sp. CinArs1]